MSDQVRVRLVTLGVLGLVFVAGVVVGVAADRTLVDARPLVSAEVAADPEADSAPEASSSRRWLIDRVDLTSDQRIQVDSVVEYHRNRMAELTRECGTRFGSIVEATRAELRSLLTVDQRAVYDSLLEERDRRRAERQGSGP